ncbi:MAG: TolC family protein [Candidatus Saccharimonas sp.]|nr:TolC family protein [Planctomycetaceae bacterium]
MIVIVLTRDVVVLAQPPWGTRPNGFERSPVLAGQRAERSVPLLPDSNGTAPDATVADSMTGASDLPVGPMFAAEDGDVQPLSERLSLNTAPRELRLRDAIQLSLSKSDIVQTLDSGGVQIADVTRYDPRIQGARSDAANAAFDPRLSAAYLGSHVNEPPDAFFGPGLSLNTRRDEGDFIATLSKPWSTGATTSVGYLPPLGYLYFPYGTTDQFNPIYSSSLVFEAKQPLLRGAGTKVNLAPLRIAQLRAEQSLWEVKQATLAQVRSVEEAYWDLQAALVTLDAMEFVFPLVTEVVRIERYRAQSERATRADVARASIQSDQFQQQRLLARNSVVEKELRLRNLMGLEVVDGVRLVPVDLPTRESFTLDHASAVANAIENRPDLVRQRLGVRIRELEYDVARNGLRPQLDLRAIYRTSGVGQRLDDSLQQLSDFQYSTWTLGLTFSVPLGNRAAKANLRAEELQLVRDRALLRQATQNVSFRLMDLIRETETSFAQYELALRRVQNTQEWLRAARIRFANPPPAGGNQDWLLLALYDYQAALRQHIDATTDAGLLLARYNTLLARVEEAQGILLENRGIELTNDPCEAVQRHAEDLFANQPPVLQHATNRPSAPAPIEAAAPRAPSSHATRYSQPPADRQPIMQAGHSVWQEPTGDSASRSRTRPRNYSSVR